MPTVMSPKARLNATKPASLAVVPALSGVGTDVVGVYSHVWPPVCLCLRELVGAVPLPEEGQEVEAVRTAVSANDGDKGADGAPADEEDETVALAVVRRAAEPGTVALPVLSGVAGGDAVLGAAAGCDGALAARARLSSATRHRSLETDSIAPALWR